MATIAAYTSPAIGHLFPIAGVLHELQRRGHRIRLRTLSSQVRAMRQLGFDADAIDPAIEQIEFDDWHARTLLEGLKRTAEIFCSRGELDGPDLQQLLDEAQPDLVITDINTWGAAAVAERAGLPWVAFSPYTPAIVSRGCPPYGAGLRPAIDAAGRLRDALLERTVTGVAVRLVMPRINGMRAKVAGLPHVRSVDEMQRLPPLTLVTTAEPLEYPHDDWEPRLRMVGPTSWEPPVAPPGWLAGVEGPLVLVTTSSEYQGDTEIVRAAVHGLRDEPVTVVATMPARVRLGIDLPSNARIVDFVPHSAVLERAVCAVTHGGMGVTQKALALGVPVVVVPWGRDQHEVAARVEHAGCGVRVNRGQLSPERVRDAVRRARRMRAGAEAVAAGFEAAGGAARAAELVEEQLALQRR
ncbi:glycosyltransferase [Agrococcus lahaulensis]|nr:glycosyltransferase [Agrococcus lahaulensis]